MSNQCYLSCSDFKGIYPSSRSGDYDAAQHTVAVSVEAMPLLWLALFRVKDLKTESFADPGAPTEQISARAFVCRTQRALTQLAEALPVLNHLFAQYGGVDSHAAALAETLRAMGGKYVSMECEEIAMLHDDEDSFFAVVRRALRLFALTPEAVAALEVVPLQSQESAAPRPRLEGFEAVKFLRRKRGEAWLRFRPP